MDGFFGKSGSADPVPPQPPTGAPAPSVPSVNGKALKKVEVAHRRARVAKFALDRLTVRGIQSALAAEGLRVSRGCVGKDVKAIREQWREEQRVDIEKAQEHELASLARDESRVRRKLTSLRREDFEDLKDYHKAVMGYQEVILKIMIHRSKILGTEAPTKVEQRFEGRVAFEDDVAKILADPEATTRLLDAVQGQVVRVPSAHGAPSTNGNGNGAHGPDPSGAAHP